jgi:DNA end-binding protein Ku
MPRPVWTGSISFGMVAIPIRLVPAVRKKSISFNQLDERDQSRIRYRKVNEDTGEEVPSEHIVKGYDVGSSQYVLITDDDLAPLAPAKSKEINLETFVPVEGLNPLMYDSSYLVLPDKNAKPYALLAEAMADSGRVGVGRFVMRQKEYLAAIRSDGHHLTLSTLVFPDELVAPESLDEFDQLEGVKVSDKELKMAKGLVDALSDDFEPDQYTDEYRLAVEHIIEQKAAGITPTFEEAPKERATVIDLAAALEASLAEARQAKGRHPSGKGAAASATAAKSTAKAAANPKRRTTKKAQPELEEAEEPAAAKPRARARKSA